MDVKELLSFEKMVTPLIIKAFYLIVSALMALGIVIGAFGALFSGQFLVFLVSLIIGVFVLVIFRMSCESIILFFKLHEELVLTRQSIERSNGE